MLLKLNGLSGDLAITKGARKLRYKICTCDFTKFIYVQSIKNKGSQWFVAQLVTHWTQG